MITLKIKQAGHTIAIPGLPVFRSPVEVDISKLDIRVVAMYLKTDGITDYQIVAEKDKQREVYTRKDFEVLDKQKLVKKDAAFDRRFNRLEKMLEILLTKETGNMSSDKEQIIKKIENLEKKISTINISNITSKLTKNKTKKNEDSEIEELSFIPDIDVSDLRMSKSENVREIKQDNDFEESADLLAGLLKK